MEKYNILGIEVTESEFDKLTIQQSQGKELKVIDGKIVAVSYEQTEQEKIELKITDLKQKLMSTDYQAIKFAEGELTAEEYEPMKLQRKAWREEIRNLEKE